MSVQFPIQRGIATASATYPTAATLKIDGNAGQIPNAFQWAQLDNNGVAVATGVDPMTPEQWAAWTNQDDANYILECVAANLGLTLEPPAKPAAVKRAPANKTATKRKR